MLDERRSRFRPDAVHDVYDSARQAGFGKYLHQTVSGKRRIFGRLDHHRVSANQRRHNLPRGYGHGKIPRRNHGANAQRLARGHGIFIGQFRRSGLAEQAAAFARHVVGHVNGFLHIAASLGQDFAHLPGHVPSQVVFAVNQRLGCAIQNLGAPGRRHQTPRFECLSGGADSGVHIFGSRTREEADQFARVCGIAIFKREAARGIHPFTIDEILENCRTHCGGHNSSEKYRVLKPASGSLLLGGSWDSRRLGLRRGAAGNLRAHDQVSEAKERPTCR